MIHSNEIEKYTDTYKDHGRNEKRTCFCAKENGCIDEKDYLHTVVKSVGKIIRERTEIMYDKDGEKENSKKSIQEVYYISDIEMSAKQMAGSLGNRKWITLDSRQYVQRGSFNPKDRELDRKYCAHKKSGL